MSCPVCDSEGDRERVAETQHCACPAVLLFCVCVWYEMGTSCVQGVSCMAIWLFVGVV